jgi:hypothetical protein
MFTVTGKIEDTTGATLHATMDFVSKSTPLAGAGIVTTNTDTTIRSNPSDGTFSVGLAAGNYSVTITASGQTTSFNIVVPSSSGTASIDTLVSSPLAFTATPPNQLWNGTWPGNITFQPLAAPPLPTWSEVSYAGGNINAIGDERYAYWVSYVTASGQTFVSPQLQTHDNGSATPNMANRIFLTPNVSGVTSVNIWRTFSDNGHDYDIASWPNFVGLLATVTPSTASYDDWESTAAFAARVNTAIIPPLYNTTAGQLLSSNGTVCAYVTDHGLFFPGANCRIVAGYGLQIYNFTTKLWYTLLNTGNPAQWSLDAGNPN